jgi:membrane-bound lytic murein transglycosylase A
MRRSIAVLLLLAACSKEPVPDRLTLERSSFGALPGWAEDDVLAALPALLKSCRAFSAEPADRDLGQGVHAGDFASPCEAAAALPVGDAAAARAFLQAAFVPFRATNHGEPEGLFTGYYEAELHGALAPDAVHATPLYRRPDDLVSVDLGAFRPNLEGDHIAGKVAKGRLVPYASRSQIEQGALAGRGLELLWVDDPVDAFFLEIQGSGRVILPDGGVVRLGYDGENGHPYVAIGRVLVDRGVPKDQISMPFLRRWIADHGAEGTALMDQNPAYVFFRRVQGDGPLGAEGVVLTPDRSAAVDRRFVPLGVPVWIDTSDPVLPGGRLQRLLVTQDTGGAIRGPVRADIFFGYGPAAAEHAGLMKGTGSWWLLLPAAAAARLAPAA